jgi:Macrocin-O-methyltransferase (TylF)
MLFKFLAREAPKFLGRFAQNNPPDLPQVERRHGTWHHADIEWMAGKVRDIQGDFAEIGVFRGAAFSKLAASAAQQGKLAHAFDSFVGMDEPTAADGMHYPKGKFDIGGPEQFIRLMTKAAVTRESYQVWAGYVPACFAQAPDALRFSLAILDLDHYRPTVESLDWLAPRVTDGGVLALDDFVPAHDQLATRAIREFLARDKHFKKIAFFNQQLILRKRYSHTKS